MPEISITEAQLERLEQIQRDVADAFIDDYGHARPGDALQYLLDTYLPPNEVEEARAYARLVRADLPELKRVANEVDVEMDADEADDLRGRLLATLGAEDMASKLDAVEGVDDETVSTPEDRATATETDDADESAEAEEGSADDSTMATEHTTPVTDAGGSLGAINELLEEHDDKWRENDGEAPYEVDLPDGSAKPARTKDDIRQILFRNY